MYQFILLMHVFIAVCIVALVLVQQGKGATLGAAFGSGASQTIFGARGSGSFLFRLTLGLVAFFFITSLTLNYLTMRAYKQAKVITMPIAPLTPRPVTAPAPAAPAQPITPPVQGATPPAPEQPVPTTTTVPATPLTPPAIKGALPGVIEVTPKSEPVKTAPNSQPNTKLQQKSAGKRAGTFANARDPGLKVAANNKRTQKRGTSGKKRSIEKDPKPTNSAVQHS